MDIGERVTILTKDGREEDHTIVSISTMFHAPTRKTRTILHLETRQQFWADTLTSRTVNTKTKIIRHGKEETPGGGRNTTSVNENPNNRN